MHVVCRVSRHSRRERLQGWSLLCWAFFFKGKSPAKRPLWCMNDDEDAERCPLMWWYRALGASRLCVRENECACACVYYASKAGWPAPLECSYCCGVTRSMCVVVVIVAPDLSAAALLTDRASASLLHADDEVVLVLDRRLDSSTRVTCWCCWDCC